MKLLVALACLSLLAELSGSGTRGSGLEAAQGERTYPDTKKFGKATVEYRKDGFQVVANYDYAQQHHDTPWLILDIAMASKQRFVLHRDHVTVVMPDGSVVKVARQEALIADNQTITLLVQNSRIFQRDLRSYFNQRSGVEAISFQSVPNTGGVSDEATVDNDHMTAGRIYFRSPGERWASGTYALVVENDRAKATLPIALQ